MINGQNCNVEPIEQVMDEEALDSAAEALLAVSGMGCINCATRVQNALVSVRGIHRAVVNLDHGTAFVAYDPDVVGIFDLVETVAAAGWSARHEYRARPIPGPRRARLRAS
jgi:copper chaperone CopZ